MTTRNCDAPAQAANATPSWIFGSSITCATGRCAARAQSATIVVLPDPAGAAPTTVGSRLVATSRSSAHRERGTSRGRWRGTARVPRLGH